MEIKTLNHGMVNSLVNLVNEVFSNYVIPIHWTSKGFELDVRENGIELDSSFMLYENGVPIGFLITALEGHIARIDAMGVIASKRGTGASEYLMQHALEHLKWKKINTVTLEVMDLDQRAVKFYKKHGFRVQRELHTLTLEVEDKRPHEYFYEDATSHTVHELSYRAQNIFHRIPNWQRTPLTLQRSEERYEKFVVFNGKNHAHPIGYVVWGENEDNFFIVDMHTITPDVELIDFACDCFKIIYERCAKKALVMANLPVDDPLYRAMIELGAKVAFVQLEMILDQY